MLFTARTLALCCVNVLFPQDGASGRVLEPKKSLRLHIGFNVKDWLWAASLWNIIIKILQGGKHSIIFNLFYRMSKSTCIAVLNDTDDLIRTSHITDVQRF